MFAFYTVDGNRADPLHSASNVTSILELLCDVLFFSVSDAGIVDKKENLSFPTRRGTYDFPISSSLLGHL